MPIGIVTVSGGAISSIDQIFNGFGYIGSTSFVLPGVKVTLPDGLNDNGTFKNQIRTVTSLEVSNNIHYNNTGIFRGSVIISPTYAGRSWKYMTCSSPYTIPPTTNGFILSENKTFQTNSSGNIISNLTTGNRISCLVDYTCNDGVVTEWKPHFIDSVANSNMSNISSAGKSFIAGMSMPSSNYIELTLGASGASYTAPANGWFSFYCGSVCDSRFRSHGGNFGNTALGKSGFANNNKIEVLKGDSVILNYSTSSDSHLFFFYAEGEI